MISTSPGPPPGTSELMLKSVQVLMMAPSSGTSSTSQTHPTRPNATKNCVILSNHVLESWGPWVSFLDNFLSSFTLKSMISFYKSMWCCYWCVLRSIYYWILDSKTAVEKLKLSYLMCYYRNLLDSLLTVFMFYFLYKPQSQKLSFYKAFYKAEYSVVNIGHILCTCSDRM